MRKWLFVACSWVVVLAYSSGALAQQSDSYTDSTDLSQEVSDRIFKPLPTITAFERFCIVARVRTH